MYAGILLFWSNIWLSLEWNFIWYVRDEFSKNARVHENSRKSNLIIVCCKKILHDIYKYNYPCTVMCHEMSAARCQVKGLNHVSTGTTSATCVHSWCMTLQHLALLIFILVHTESPVLLTFWLMEDKSGNGQPGKALVQEWVRVADLTSLTFFWHAHSKRADQSYDLWLGMWIVCFISVAYKYPWIKVFCTVKRNLLVLLSCNLVEFPLSITFLLLLLTSYTLCALLKNNE